MEFVATIEGVTVRAECEGGEVVAAYADDEPLPAEWLAAHEEALRDAALDASCSELERRDAEGRP